MKFLIKLLRNLIRHKYAIIPLDPSPKLLNSMAMRMDHSFCSPQSLTDEEIEKARQQDDDFAMKLTASTCMTSAEKEQVLKDMARLYDEIVGRGFYRYEI